MNVLITGGYGFIGSHTVERFCKEGHQVVVIDNLSTGKSAYVSTKHKFYKLDVVDTKCDEVFSNHRFDVVIHLAAQIDAAGSAADPMTDARQNVLGVVNMLNLSSKHQVKKFIFASSAAVYGHSDQLHQSEEGPVAPLNPYGVSKLTGEQYCRLWKAQYGLQTVSLRLANVYGPRQSVRGDGAVVASFMYEAAAGGRLTVHGSGEQTRDFIYVEDVVDAIYKASGFTSHDVINVSSGKQTSINQLVKAMQRLSPYVEIEHGPSREGDITHSVLANNRATTELLWTPLYSLEAGCQKTYSWYQAHAEQKSPRSRRKASKKPKEKIEWRLPRQLLAYVENILAFLLVLFLTNYMQGSGVEAIIDLKLVYIIVIAIVYGQHQALIAVVLACSLFIIDVRRSGTDLVALMYSVDTLIHFCFYIFTGVVLGYSIESKKLEIEFKDVQLKDQQQKFNFLQDMYNESKIVRRELKEQIISTTDSFGKIYTITASLDTLEPERIFAASVGVIEDLLKAGDVSIYALSKNQHYLRLLASSKDSQLNLQKSIRIDDSREVAEVIRSRTVFANKEMSPGLPMLMSPIVIDNRVIAIVAIYTLEFETLSLYKQNLLKVVTDLISSSLARAYQYEQALDDERYVPGTLVYNADFFERIIAGKRESRLKNNSEFVMLRVHNNHWQEQDWTYALGRNLRELDYMGTNTSGDLLVLLANTRRDEARYVIERLSALGAMAEILEDVAV